MILGYKKNTVFYNFPFPKLVPEVISGFSVVKPGVDAIIASIIDATLNLVFQLPLARVFFLAQVWDGGSWLAFIRQIRP